MSIGPFETEREASSLPQVRAIYEAFDADPGAGKMAPHNRQLLVQALEAAGVAMGGYDDRIAGWLAGWEPHVVAVIAGWVSRANRAGSEDQADGDDERCCPDCDGNPHHLAAGCQDAAEGGQR